MSNTNSVFKKLGRVLTIFVLGAALLLTAACNSGDLRGARPENPPVQMGGGNNPYKRVMMATLITRCHRMLEQKIQTS